MWARIIAAASAVTVIAVGAALSSGHPLPGAKHCRIFPRNNAWNQRVDKLPVARNSHAVIRSIGLTTGLHPDFGSGKYGGGPIGIPFKVVSPRQKRVKVKFGYASESDRVRYPIPKNVPIEGGRKSRGDRHVLLVDRGRCKLYELYAAYPRNGGRSWRAGSGAVWSLKSNHLRPKGWTSADAAGLPILPGLARWDEVRRGSIDHALRFTVDQTRNAYVYPARHAASDQTSKNLPPMGLRVRLKRGVNISHFPRQARIVLKALKRYGMIVADNGSSWFISGAPNRHWNNDALHTIGAIHGGDFEVVNTSSLPHPGR
jgi:hypothetical protein